VTKTFGRRGLAPYVASPALRADAAAGNPDRVLEHGPGALPFDAAIGEKSLIADIPFLTVCMIVALLFIFAAEKHLALEVGKNGNFDVGSLIALGAVSYDLVVGSGEWWRVGLAPLLHASLSHVLGNSVALFFIGARLEPMIGRGWLMLIFVASALGGVAGSLLGNPHGVPSVGASGAITGLIGALFVVSFHGRADPAERHAMLVTSLRFGVPALVPLAFGASSHVDYFAHAGGAITGGAVGLAVCAQWSPANFRPDFARQAAMAALLGLTLSIVCCGIAATRYSTYAAKPAQFIPSAEMPSEIGHVGAQQSADLLARYPKDPRSHLVRAFYLARADRYEEAVTEFRATMAMVSSEAAGQAIRDLAQAALAVVLTEQGHRDEGKALAKDLCRAKDKAPVIRILDAAKLCN
jgi:membrane associated rhomboid family serine protease